MICAYNENLLIVLLYRAETVVIKQLCKRLFLCKVKICAWNQSKTISEMPLCGPKLSLCGVVLSIWGIIQLSIMGVFFYINSVALIEDINLEETYSSMDRLRTDMDKGYQQNALNCWIAGIPRL